MYGPARCVCSLHARSRETDQVGAIAPSSYAARQASGMPDHTKRAAHSTLDALSACQTHCAARNVPWCLHAEIVQLLELEIEIVGSLPERGQGLAHVPRGAGRQVVAR